MKNIKNMLTLIIAVVTLFSTQCVFSAPVVEIYNKTNESIQVDIADGSSRKDITTAYVGPDQQWNSGDRPTITLNTKLLMQVSTKTNPSPKAFIIENADGKTKYLSWDSAKTKPLYPQTGPLLGLLGKTKSGLSLSNNVNAENIAPTSPLATPQMPKKPSQEQPASTQPKPTQPKPSQPISTNTKTGLNFRITNATDKEIHFFMRVTSPNALSETYNAFISPKNFGDLGELNLPKLSEMLITITPMEELEKKRSWEDRTKFNFVFDRHGKEKMFFKWDGKQLILE